MREIAAGIDIGGTKTNMGLFDLDGKLLMSKKIETTDLKQILDVFTVFCVENNEKDNVTSIGIGIPGTVDKERGLVVFAPNINWKNIEVTKPFQQCFKTTQIRLGQDTECAAIGEYLFGAGAGMNDIICLTLGTGIGCGIILNGKIYKGKFGTAGEFGHTIAVYENGRKCGCGLSGCLEAYSSGRGIAAAYRESVQKGRQSNFIHKETPQVKSEDIFTAAKAGCSLCEEIVAQAVDYLAAAIVSAINLVSVEVVIISGGMSVEKDIFITPLFEKVNRRVYPLLRDRIKLSVALLGEASPMFGAAFMNRINNF